MVASVRGYTPNYSFKLVNFDTPRWHTLEYANWQQLDAILLQAGIASVRGEWLYNTTYLVGDRVFDAVTNDLYRCLVEHISASSGTFQQDRIAHPGYWALQLPGVPLFRGAWAPNAQYALGDIVFTDEFTYRLCSSPHISHATFPPDVAYWQIIFDAHSAVDAAEGFAFNASVSAGAASSSASSAALSSTNALNASINSANSATASQNSANAADTSEANALTSANNAAASAVDAANSALDAADSALVSINQSAALRGTSVTPNDIALGTKLFETQAGKQFNPGTYLTIVSNVNPTIAMTGMSMGYTNTTLQINVTNITGAGIFSDWSIYVSGADGLDGVNGTPGQPGIDGDPGIFWRGNWNSATQYVVHDGVSHLGASYICAVAHVNSAPPSVNWGLLAQAGSTVLVDDQVLPQNLDADTGPKQLLFRDRLNVVSRAGDTMVGQLNLPTPPISPGNAVRKDYVDNAVNSVDLSTRVAKAGDTMTGQLVLPSAPAPVAANAVRKDYVDTADATLNSAKVNRAGDTMTGHLMLPTGPADSQAVRKDYVDAATAAVVSNAVMKNTAVSQQMIGNLSIAKNATNGATLTLINSIAGGSQWDIASSGVDHGPVGELCFWHPTASTVMRLRPSDKAILGAGPIAATAGLYAGYLTGGGRVQFGNTGVIDFNTSYGNMFAVNRQIRVDANDPQVHNVAPNGGHARTFHTVTGTRSYGIGVLNDGNFCITDETAGAFRFSLYSSGGAQFNGTLGFVGGTCSGDYTIYRPGAPSTGVVYFGNAGTRYIYSDGGTFHFTGTITIGEPSSGSHGATKNYVDGAVGGAGFLPLSGGTVYGKFIGAGGVWTTMGYGGSAGAVEVQGPGGGAEAIISFHRVGAFGINFGLGANNHLNYGGWSHGGSVWLLWSNAFFSDPMTTGRWVYAGDAGVDGNGNVNGLGGMNELWGGAAVTGLAGYAAYSVYQLRFRYFQVYTNAWYTLAFV